jgi:hypothetical protein
MLRYETSECFGSRLEVEGKHIGIALSFRASCLSGAPE